jgi:hypothetical protein
MRSLRLLRDDGALANAVGLRAAAVVMALPALLAATVDGITLRRRSQSQRL